MKQPNSGTLLKSYILQEVVPFFSRLQEGTSSPFGGKKKHLLRKKFTVDYLLLRKWKRLLPNCVKGNMMLAFQNKLFVIFHNICLQNTKTLADNFFLNDKLLNTELLTFSRSGIWVVPMLVWLMYLCLCF